jgi:hypothetical protein
VAAAKEAAMGGRIRAVAVAAALTAALGISAAPAVGASKPDQACTAIQTQRGYLGDTHSQTVTPVRSSVSSFDVGMGFTQRWSQTVVARLVRMRPVGVAGVSAVQTQTLAEVSRKVTASPYTIQWVHFQLPQPVDVATTAALGTLAIQLVDLPAPTPSGGVAAWLQCGATYPGGQIYATMNVLLPNHPVATPAQAGYDADALFRLYT